LQKLFLNNKLPWTATHTVHNVWPILYKTVMYELVLLKLLKVMSNLTVPYFVNFAGQQRVQICMRVRINAKNVY